MAQTITVADYMIKKLITLKPEMDISVAIELFIKHFLSCGKKYSKNSKNLVNYQVFFTVR